MGSPQGRGGHHEAPSAGGHEWDLHRPPHPRAACQPNDASFSSPYGVYKNREISMPSILKRSTIWDFGPKKSLSGHVLSQRGLRGGKELVAALLLPASLLSLGGPGVAAIGVTSPAWALCAIGLCATIALCVYISICLFLLLLLSSSSSSSFHILLRMQ